MARYHNQTTPPESIARVERNEKAIELRRQGRTYAEIATALGISQRTAHRIITAEMMKRRDRLGDKADSLIQMQIDRLEMMWNRLQPRIDRGETRAIEVGIQLSRRMSEMMGLDQPKKIHNTHELIELSDDEIQQEAERLRLDVAHIDIPALLPGEERPALPPPDVLDAEVVDPSSPDA